MKLALLAAGGVLGTFSRYWLSGALQSSPVSGFPYGTLAVNALGCLAAGFLATLGQGETHTVPEIRLFFLVGFCGAFTTFSAFVFDTHHLMRAGQATLAFGNVLASVVTGFAAFFAGAWIGSRI
jgi:fluoride exporter